MNRKILKRAAGMLAAAVFSSLTVLSVYAVNTDINSAKNKKTELEKEKEKTERIIGELAGLKKDASAYIERLDNELNIIENEISRLNGEIEAKNAEIEQTAKELEKAKLDEKEQFDAMKLRIKYMYEQGEASYIDMLLGSDDVNELLSRAEYIKKISEYDRDRLDDYEETSRSIELAGKKLEEERSALTALKDEQSAKQSSAQALLADKRNEMAAYNKKIDAAEDELSEYERQIKAQEDTIKAIEAEIRRREEAARKAAEAAGKSYKTVNLGDIHFGWPCPASSRITSGFGARQSPTEGASSYHQGLDIGAPTGTDIVASAAGEVIVSTYSPSAGNYIMISHGGGVYTVYMHCSSLGVSAGTSVSAGQSIAKVGSTGYSTGPHLHFGIRAGGRYLNPANYVSP